MSRKPQREFLFDVSRLIWRSWRGRPATGIDRVCLAYLEHFGAQSQLVVQRRGRIKILSADASDRLATVLATGAGAIRLDLIGALVPALLTASRTPPRPKMLYLNVGHTGLDDAALPDWIAVNAVRAIYMIHDLIPLTHPQFCRAGEEAKHERRIMNALSSARGLILNSHDTLDALNRFAASRGVTVPNALIAWLGISKAARPAAATSERPYFVVVGTIEGRKNHLLLLRAWERLVDAMGAGTPELAIIGGRGWEADEVFSRLDHPGRLAGHVREVSGCSDGELITLVAGARALLMPSFVEGYGLPVLEALQLGTPVLASDLPIFREIAGDLPTYLDPQDPAAWADTVRDFLGETTERRRQLSAMTSFEATTWEQHFRAVDQWLGTH